MLGGRDLDEVDCESRRLVPDWEVQMHGPDRSRDTIEDRRPLIETAHEAASCSHGNTCRERCVQPLVKGGRHHRGARGAAERAGRRCSELGRRNRVSLNEAVAALNEIVVVKPQVHWRTVEVGDLHGTSAGLSLPSLAFNWSPARELTGGLAAHSRWFAEVPGPHGRAQR